MKKIISTFIFSLLFITGLTAQTFEWVANSGSSAADFGLSTTTDASGNVYTTGAFNGTIDIDPGPGTTNFVSAGNSDIFVTKFNSTGILLWAKQIGGSSLDQGNAIEVDATGNVFIGGTFATTVDFDPGAGVVNKTVAAASDAFILKLDANGDFVWVSTFSGTGNEQVKALTIDASGNVLSTGFWYMTCDFDPGAATYNILASVTNSQSSAFISKLDASGNFVWAGEIGGGQFHEGNSIKTDASGNVYVGGYKIGGTDFDPGAGTVTSPFGGGQDAFIVKLTSTGTFITYAMLNGTGHDILYSLDLDATGNVVATGFFNATTDFDPTAATVNLTSLGLKDIFVIKFTQSLGYLWTKAIGSTLDDNSYGIACDGSDNIYVTGNFQGTMDIDPGAGTTNYTALGQYDVFVLKLNSSGNYTYSKKFGSTTTDTGQSIAVSSSGSEIYTTGQFSDVCNFNTETGDYFKTSNANSQDLFIHKLGTCTTPAAQTITATQTALCPGGSTTINLTTSQAGVNYYLKNDVTNSVISGPVMGTGGSISLNTGVLNSTTTFSVSGSFTPYATNYALDLDGVDDYIYLGTNNRGITTAVTVSARVKTTVTGASQFIASKYISAGIGYYLLVNSTGQATFQGRDVAGALKSSGLSTTMVADNQWHEITGVVRSTGWEIWVDGVLESSGSYALGTGLSTTAGLLVGQFGSTYCPAKIDRIALWNTSLSSSEILTNASGCIDPAASNLVAYYPFNEGNGTNVYDFSSSNITGTLTNMSVPSDWIAGSGLNCSTICDADLSNNVTVTVFSAPAQPTITAGGPTTFCSGGSVTLSSSTGTTYQWSLNGSPIGGANSSTLNVTAAGTYTVIITNASGCQSIASAGVSVIVNSLPATPTVTTSGPTTFCAGGGPATLFSSAGTTYQWSLNGTPIGGATASSYATTTGGTYTVVITNSVGCQSASSSGTVITVNPNPATPTISASGSTALCSGGSVTLTSSAGSSYLWSNGATTASINVSTAGTYSVQVTNAAGCQSAASTGTTVTVGTPPATPTISAGGPTTFCAGGSVTLTSSAGTSYLWSNGATTASISPTTSGTYSVQVTNAAGCQSAASAGTTVTVNALPSAPTISAGGPTTFCAGGSVTLTSSAGTSYLWSNGATTASISPTTSGTYSVQVTNAAGCQSAASTGTTVTVNALPSTPTITAGGPTTFCAGGSVTLTSSAGTSYLWSNGATTASISPTTSGTYTVQVTNAAGCQSAGSAGTTVTVNTLPSTPTITAGGPTTFCAGGSVTLTSSAGTSYLWSNGATTASISPTTSGTYTVQVTNAAGCQSAASTGTTVIVNALPSTPTITVGGPTTFCAGGSVTLNSSAGTSYLWSNGATTASISPTTTGTYSVQVTNAAGCQSTSSTATTVTVNSLPNAPIISPNGATTFCDGGSVNLASSAGITYLWSNGSTAFAIDVTNSGTYSVQITDPNGCQSPASSPVTVTVNPLPVITQGTTNNPTSCTIDNGSIEVNGSGTGTLSWSGTASGSQTVSTFPSSITNLGDGSYVITFSDANACVSTPLNVSLSAPAAPAAPTINAGGSTAFCAGESVTLTASAGTTYLWSNGATTASISVTNAGNYSVSITDASGCSSPSSAATSVTVNALPMITTGTMIDPTSCITSDGSIEVSGTGTGDLSWTGAASGSSNGATLPATVPNLGQGNYTFTFTDANGCTSEDLSVTLTAPGAPAAPIVTANGPITFCEGGSVTLTASAATDYLWSNGETTQSINVTGDGTFSVIITDANGCTSPASTNTTVTVDVMPNLSVTMNNNVITAAQSGATYQWIDCSDNSAIAGETGQTFTPAANGNYAVVITSGTCSDTSVCTAITTIGLDEIHAFQLSVNPNPGTDMVQVNSNGNVQEIAIYTATGELVRTVEQTQFTIRDLARGMYLLRVTTSEGIGTLRLIKE